MDEHWIGFDAERDDALALITVDLAFTEVAPDDRRPHLVRVTIGFNAVLESGLPDASDLDAVNALEDPLLARMEATGAAMVGRVITDGRRHFFFYTPDPAASEAAAASALRGVKDREVAVEASHDPEWALYSEYLLPTGPEYRRSQDAQVVHALEEAGDPLEVPRPVDHFIFFTEQAPRDEFAQQARDAGFEVELLEAEAGLDDEEPYGVRLRRDDPVDLDSISAVTIELDEAADNAGGRYDGWEAVVVNPDGTMAMDPDEDEDEDEDGEDEDFDEEGEDEDEE